MESFTYGEVDPLSARFAAELDVRKIVKGDRIMLWGAELRRMGGGVHWMRASRSGRCADG